MIALARQKKILGINFWFYILSKHGQWNINRRIFKNLDIKPGHSSSRVVFI